MAYRSVYNTARYAMRSNNRSGIRGVSWDKRSKRYRAYAFHEGKQISLGWRKNALDAAVLVSDFRMKHYPLQEKPPCALCGDPVHPKRGGKYCGPCEGRVYRAKKAAREGLPEPPYKRRKPKAAA